MICTCCGSSSFYFQPVLWEKLISDWRLSKYEVDYINRQQGLICNRCGSSLRIIALAAAIMKTFKFQGEFKNFVRKREFKKLKILEVNSAGCISQFLKGIRGYIQSSYPEVDMMMMKYKDKEFDLVIHSDVLEHIENPRKGLQECYRVLKENGICIFTVPIIVDRLSMFRENNIKSYHGLPGSEEPDLLVYTEYGSDVWQEVIQSGFSECRIYSHEYPSANVLICVK